MPIRVCLAGATGWAGSELARAIARQPDLTLVAAISRTHAGRNLAEVLGDPRVDCPIYASAREALAVPCDVFVEYTKPDSAKHNVLAALEHGAHVVVGTSGLTDDDFADFGVIARRQNRAVLACGNFALTVVLFTEVRGGGGELIPQWEIIDAHDDGPTPSGTALSWRPGWRRWYGADCTDRSNDRPSRKRGASPDRRALPSHLPRLRDQRRVIFRIGQTLSIRHDSGSATSYVDGALIAIRRVSTLVGVHQGLDSVLDL
jgi:4-hydroxy-tetrahydrodipicolinate reductase